MSIDYVVLENIPNTPEGRAFLKQLRKYLRPEYKMRSRGRHSDRAGLAKELVKQGIYTEFANQELPPEQHANYVHQKLRAGMSCKYAERITTVVEPRNIVGVYKYGGEWWYVPPGMTRKESQGPFRKYEAALAAKRMTEGIRS